MGGDVAKEATNGTMQHVSANAPGGSCTVMTDSTASVSASTMAFIEGALGVVVFLVPRKNSGEVSGESSPFPFVLLCIPASECRACVRDNVC